MRKKLTKPVAAPRSGKKLRVMFKKLHFRMSSDSVACDRTDWPLTAANKVLLVGVINIIVKGTIETTRAAAVKYPFQFVPRLCESYAA